MTSPLRIIRDERIASQMLEEVRRAARDFLESDPLQVVDMPEESLPTNVKNGDPMPVYHLRELEIVLSNYRGAQRRAEEGRYRAREKLNDYRMAPERERRGRAIAAILQKWEMLEAA